MNKQTRTHLKRLKRRRKVESKKRSKNVRRLNVIRTFNKIKNGTSKDKEV